MKTWRKTSDLCQKDAGMIRLHNTVVSLVMIYGFEPLVMEKRKDQMMSEAKIDERWEQQKISKLEESGSCMNYEEKCGRTS